MAVVLGLLFLIMRSLLLIISALLLLCVASCQSSESEIGKSIDEAEKLMQARVDSAMAILDVIDPSELKSDSLRAKYVYLKAYGHMRQNRSMIADSLISFACAYYRDKDIVKDIRSTTAHAWYKFWVGDTQGAINMLDSLVNLRNVPDSLMVHTLRVRVLLGAAEYQGRELIPLAKRLQKMETDTLRQLEAKYILVSAYEYAQELDSALMLNDELMHFAANNFMGDRHFIFAIEHVQILTEMGREEESDKLIAYIFDNAGKDNGASDCLHLQSAMNALNTGNIENASRQLAVADSLALGLRHHDDAYYRSYSSLLHAMIDFKKTGRMKLAHVNSLNNRQRERYNRIEASQWESERGALRQQSRAMALKAQNEHKTVLILVVALVALMILVGAAWILHRHRQRERENEERAEALQKMVDELKSAPIVHPQDMKNAESLRRAMLQQLGIIKMVAEAPTEQNREMLRKISSVGGETGGELVNWGNVFELIDNLYSGFYSKLRSKYSHVLTPKEEQIIVLMIAGFSTKEISVITSQTTATIYVRKSAIRKKLGVPEKEDIVAFLRNDSAI